MQIGSRRSIAWCAAALVVGAAFMPVAAVAAPASPDAAPGKATETSVSQQEARYHFALALALQHEADYAGARHEFNRAVELDRDAPYLRLAYAEFLYRLGELDAARLQASTARRLAPDKPEPIRLLARIELRQVDRSSEAVEKALVYFKELAQMLPDDIEARVSSGRLLLGLGRFDEAAVVLAEAYELRPGDLRLASLLIAAFQNSRDRAEAENGLRGLLAEFPEFLEARIALANTLAEQGRHGDAVAILEGASAEQLEVVDVQRLLALELYRTGSWERSLAASEKWVQLAPGESTARYIHALGLSAVGRYPEAEEVLRGLNEEDPGSFDTARVLADVIERQGRAQEGAEILIAVAERLDEEGSSDLATQARLEHVDLEVRSQNWENVLALSQSLLESKAEFDRGELELIRGQALLESGRSASAIELFAKLAADASVGDRARAHEAEALFRSGDTATAESRLARITETGDSGQLTLAARALHRLELYERAIPLWQRLKEEDPGALEVRFWLGSAHERAGRRDSAIREFQDLLEIDGLFAPALNYLGYMWAEQGENLLEAVTLVERAVAIEPNNGAYIDSLGWALYQLGKYQEARGHLEKAAELERDDAVVFEHLGDLYVAMGHRSLAADSYRRALDLSPENPEVVRRKLGQLEGDS